MWRKRLFDLALLLPVLPFYALVFVALAALVRVVDGRPVFFFQLRAGRHRRPFRVFKLRTMTGEPDPRARSVTRLGGFLRRRGLDELPQLLNILLGDMSLVGPRPLAVEDADRLVGAHSPFAARFDLPPGLTGPAQVQNLRGVHRTAEVESAYAETRTAIGDLRILARTAWINVVGKPKATEIAAALKPGPWRRRLRRLSLGGLVVLLVAWFGVAHEVNRLRVLEERGGASAFQPLDLASVGLLNVVMALGGYVAGYWQVADETLLLFVPSDSGERAFRSDFAMRAPEIRAAAQKLVARLDRGEARPSASVWLAGPLAVRLAFSIPVELSAERTPAGVAFNVRTSIVYPRKAVIPLGPGPTGAAVLFDEGMFWVLQERGWFHPYHANWKWTLPPNDSRLRPGDAKPTLRERVTISVWKTLVGLTARR